MGKISAKQYDLLKQAGWVRLGWMITVEKGKGGKSMAWKFPGLQTIFSTQEALEQQSKFNKAAEDIRTTAKGL